LRTNKVETSKRYFDISAPSASPAKDIDEMQKVVHYYYCKNNLNRYQKKKTSIAMFTYEIQKIECEKPQ
jgi:hypothetical protein